jgi:hypothetical protein
MYCTKCGAQILDGSKYCSKCGNLVTIACNVEAPEPEIDTETKIFEFVRHKSLGRMDISHVISVAEISGESFKLAQQKIILYFIKRTPVETTHSIIDIASMRIKKSLDISDIFIAIVFAAAGFANPILFLCSLVFLWVGIGRKIEITKSNGSVIVIPAENEKNWIPMFEALTKINSGIVLQQK